ncbi:MAG TPA: NAD(P)-binding domain-containing protein [Gammaproteobacteria bacterium]|nr:NAD(P)-binding domain-containing protein [Gammaproteobacteria bacterium]
MKSRIRWIGGLSALLVGAVMQAPASAETIAVIGTGNVGAGLGPEFAAQGHTIVYGHREPNREDVQALVARTPGNASVKLPAEAVIGADMVLLAVPGTSAVEITESLGDLSGKIIIDPTNVVSREGGRMSHGVPGKGSNAAMIQEAAPDAVVVKAFNTLNWQQMVNPETAGGPITIMLAGENAEAKAAVAGLVRGMGLDAVDVGGLEYAHVLEEMLVMWANSLGSQPFNYYLRPMPRN